jgi:seryl-tRNA synthetase
VIDLRLLRSDPERVRASQRARGDDPGLVDALLSADEARRAAVTRADALRAEQKAVSSSVRTAGPDERPAVLERAQALAAQVKQAEAEQGEDDAALRAAHLAVPNVVLDGVPPAGSRTTWCWTTWARCPPTTSRCRTTSTSARPSGPSTPSAAPRSAAAASRS